MISRSKICGELAEAKAANEALKEQVVAEQQAEFESKIEALEATIAEQAEAIKMKDQAIKEKEEAIKKGSEDMKKKMEELREMKKKEGMGDEWRKAQLKKLVLKQRLLKKPWLSLKMLMMTPSPRLSQLLVYNLLQSQKG